MGEGEKGEPLHKNSPAIIFNDLVKRAIEEKKSTPISVVGTMDEEERDVVKDFLTRPETQNFLERIKSDKQYQGLGIVTEITQVDSQKHIFYTDQWGMPLSFVYDSKSPLFSAAPNGFQVGDIRLRHGPK